MVARFTLAHQSCLGISWESCMAIGLRISSFSANIGFLIKHPVFQQFIIALIILNAVLLGLDTVPAIVLRYGSQLVILDQIIITIFVF